MVEVASLHLTSIALKMIREEALAKAHKDQTTNSTSSKSSSSSSNCHMNGSSTGAPGDDRMYGGSSGISSSSSINQNTKGKRLPIPPPPQHAFDKELSRRQMALFFYLIRSPIFDRATLPILERASKFLSYVPILNSLPGHVISMLTYLHKSHFRSSTSSSTS
jgi:Peroxisomal membrane protein (Pex16)